VKTNLIAPVALVGAIVLVAGLGSSRPAAAQGFYLGGALSHAAINATVIDEARNSYKFFLGYEFPVFVGIEAGWVNFGTFDGVITAAGGSTRVGYDAKTATAALTGRVPIGGLVTLYAKAGYMYWSTDVALTGTATDPHFEVGTDHGHDPFFGAGVRFNFGRLSVLGEWERYRLRDVDINAVSAGVRVTL
jgi:OOP family OmpA-OmpF porin